jgi:hypothetical protein
MDCQELFTKENANQRLCKHSFYLESVLKLLYNCAKKDSNQGIMMCKKTVHINLTREQCFMPEVTFEFA